MLSNEKAASGSVQLSVCSAQSIITPITVCVSGVGRGGLPWQPIVMFRDAHLNPKLLIDCVTIQTRLFPTGGLGGWGREIFFLSRLRSAPLVLNTSEC